ncbi:MAG: UvrB/UvrC motif-containing protein [Spirochaetales bacterium]|jgi:hypothetical protein|nr:UvrB/UvrC motif-containing protein [Spirochaetales bacterium]
MKLNITQVLNAWPYNPQNQIRIVTAQNGKKVIQLRLPLGIEQYDLDGRPDGERPYGADSVLDEFKKRLRECAGKHMPEAGFHFTHKEYIALRKEAALYYSRYLLLFQAGEFTRALRDSAHNMKICSFVEKYAAPSQDRTAFLEYKPYIFWIYTVSRLMLILRAQDIERAKIILQEAIAEMHNFPGINTLVFHCERKRSLRQIDYREPVPLGYLQKELEQAVREENYEKAAFLRDRLWGKGIDEPPTSPVRG